MADFLQFIRPNSHGMELSYKEKHVILARFRQIDAIVQERIQSVEMVWRNHSYHE
jgi:hypothetical protein